MTNAINVNLPDTETTVQIEEPKKPLVLSIDAEGKIYLDKDEYALEILQQELESRKLSDPELRLNLNTDDAVNYGVVAKVMVLIEKAGIEKLSMVTERGS
uniref:ExbD/TolR family protein n=1 Tax=Cellvibrio fontiphilus TaxID=1815559 RepID=UPI002B4BC68C|nr:biopolymer transporter ExbD [Cellvibrio fontiphilus]